MTETTDQSMAALDALREQDGEHAGKFVIDAEDITLDGTDRMTKLVRSGGAGQMVALTFTALHERDRRVTMPDVKRLKLKEIELVGDTADALRAKVAKENAEDVDVKDVDPDQAGDEGPDFPNESPSESPAG